MRRLLTFLLVIAGFLVVGCSRTVDTPLKVHNGTDHLLFVTMSGVTDTLQAQSTRTYSIPINDPANPFADGEKTLTIGITGETFLIVDSNQHPIYQTEITMTSGETKKIFAWPDYACVKVVNQSGKRIASLLATQIAPNGNETNMTLSGTIEPGATFFKRLEYGTEDAPMTYDFLVNYEDGTFASYPGIELELDELYLIN
jgi:hypothetical protein